VPQNYITAYMWLNLAASQAGNEELRQLAAKSRDDVAAKVTPAEIAEAQRLLVPNLCSGCAITPTAPDQAERATVASASSSGAVYSAARQQ
jgi:hypothetical protein